MGFSIKLAPGVRVRASSRGVRTSLGPRMARVSVGTGRTRFSSGVGPVSYSTSLGAAPRRSASSRPGTAAVNRQLAAARRQAAATEKADEASRLAAALQAIASIHREAFASATRPVAPAPPPADAAAILSYHRTRTKSWCRFLPRAERHAALAEAERHAGLETAWVEHSYLIEQASWQAAADDYWARLARNDPDTVLATLVNAFEDNEAAAAAVGVDGSEASLVVFVPAPDVVPDRKPAQTPAGNLTLKKLTRREAADFYRLLVAGHTLVTVKEAFAVAPGLASVRVAAVRHSAPDSYGRRRPEVLLAARIRRTALDGVLWHRADAMRVLLDVSDELLCVPKGASQELTAIYLGREPGLAELLSSVDLES